MISLKNLAEKLKSERKIALFLHVRPDGDAIGSALALKLVLEELGAECDVYCDDAIPERFFFLPSAAFVKNGAVEKNYTAMVAIDCAESTRLGKYATDFCAHKNTFVIDHHETNVGFSKNDYVKSLPANCENVYNLIKFLGVEIKKETANALATGIITDTGNLRHKNVTPSVIRALADLVEKGADLNAITFNMFTAQSKERAKLFALTMEKIRYFHDGKIAIATVTKNNLQISGAKPDETEGFIDFVMGIRGVEVGACLLEQSENKYKVSLRGKETDVAEVASVFGGGGHVLASGCQIRGEYEEVIDRLVFAIKRCVKD